MYKVSMAAAGLAMTATMATAGGLDRNNTPIDILFEKGNYAELSFAVVSPSLSGTDLLGNGYSGVGRSFDNYAVGVKLEFNDRWSFAAYADQPYGASIQYQGNPATTLLGGTAADAESEGYTFLLRYKFTDRFSVYGGPRIVRADGTIQLSGLAYGAVNGYRVNYSTDEGLGWVAGAAYEVPEIGLRVSGTYHSSVDLGLSAAETFPATAAALLPAGTPTGVPLPTGTTRTSMPQSFELAAQTGVNEKTLVFGSVRWSEWEDFTLVPPALGANLAQLDNVWTYEIGVARRFSDKFAASLAFIYEPEVGDSLVSPLAPTRGQQAIRIGGRYDINDRVTLSAGVRYVLLGNALPETGTPDTARGVFTDNDAIGVGIKLGVKLN